MKFRKTILLTLGCLSALSGQVVAQNFGTQTSYDEELKKVRQFAPLQDSLFGEQINLQDGTVSFKQTDVSVTTKNGNKIEFGRVSETRTTLNAFAPGWGMDVPYMVGTYDTRAGWNAAGAGNLRCSTGRFAPSPQHLQFVTETTNLLTQQTTRIVTTSSTLSPAHVFWHGIEINIPSIGNEQLLETNAFQHLPDDGRTYVGTTKSGWRIRCLPSINNGPGEGFAVLLPDGTTYYFDKIITVKVRDYIEWANSSSIFSNPRYSYQLPLANYFLLATKVIDRHGNAITYQYSEGNSSQLTAIYADDGTRLDFHYDSETPGTTGFDSSTPSITEIRSGTRKWTYSYLQSVATPELPTRINLALQSITFPDGSSWKFEGTTHFTTFSDRSDVLGSWKTTVANFWEHNFAENCKNSIHNLGQTIVPAPQNSYSFRMTHPSGAVGEFVFKHRFHGINNAPGSCQGFINIDPNGFGPPTSVYTLGVPNVYLAKSLESKKITGYGLSTDLVWNFAYNPSWSFASGCSNSPWRCNDRSITSITSPDGKIERIEIGNNYVSNYGQTLARTIEKDGQTLQEIRYEYLPSVGGQSFPENTGNVPLGTGVADMYGNPNFYKNRPLIRTIISKEGVTYTTESAICPGGNYCFDSFARPTTIRRANTLGTSRTDKTEYYDDLTAWILGQSRRVTNVETGMVVSETDYNAQSLPWRIYRYGKLLQTLTYNGDGTVKTVADGRGNITTLSNWKRGIPRLITYPDNTTQSATVDDNGWITSVTDESGFVTGYGYDAMGRLASVVHPTGDGVSYHNEIFGFQPLTAADWKPANVATGQWRHFEVTGNRTKITYFDAMWRPVLVHEYDAANVGPSLRSTRIEYDSSGRVRFQSYPSSDLIPGSSGARIFYDALDRVVRVEKDSEHGVLTTTTEYLSGLRTRVTNPRGHQVTTSFLAWDQPGYDLPILSEQPEGKIVQINRHLQFGWPLALIQRNTANTLGVTRRYVYDSHAQLCKTIEPETGATVMGYDAAGNLAWSASGLYAGVYTSATDCQLAASYGSGRTSARSYDSRNRLSQLTFPDGRGNQIWTYTPDGLPASITAYNGLAGSEPVTTAYTYNKRRLLTGESITQFNGASPWYTWTIGYAYDAYGHLAAQTYPTGLVVDYAPNPLGQATKAGAYASGAQYYPNGALKQFTYGNGIVHTMQQNARQLPSRVTSSGGVNDFTYNYDANGNVTNIWDLIRGDNYSRWLSYDNLDRLTAAGSASFGGDAWHRFTYDALDNLESWKLAGVKDYADYVYDQQNRLLSIRNTAGATVVGLQYDEQGNLQNKNGQDYVFDYGNRLRNVAGKESYRYDGLGRRVQTIANNGTTTLWQYSQSGQMLFWSDWEGPNYLNQKTHENVYLAGSLIATIDHAWPSNAVLGVKYQHTDALGSPVAVTNASGQVIERVDYEPWGAIIGNPTRSGMGYTGHVMDGATGLTYMQQRYYDQSIGKFLSVDPVTAHEKPGQNFNRYWYANNSPFVFGDPDGRQSKKREQSMASLGTFLLEVLGGTDSESADMMRTSTTDGKFQRPDGNGSNRGAANGSRAGKDHTQAAKRRAREQNRTENGGRCPKCDVQMTEPQQSKRGVAPDPNQAEGDHIVPKSQGGDGATVKDMRNIETICRSCNLEKRDKNESDNKPKN